MFRLKLIKKPILLKLKTNFSFPPIVLANMQEKEAIPTKEKQEIVPDKNYDGLSKVIVDKIPDEYIIPTGNIEITKNGIYNVREKETATVNIPEPKLGTKNITENGIYKASDDNLDGYSEVNVGIKSLFTGSYDRQGLKQIGWTDEEIDYYNQNGVQWNESEDEYFKLTQTELAGDDSKNTRFIPKNSTKKSFDSYYKLLAIPQLNTSEVTGMRNMFNNCYSLTTIPLLDTSKVTNIGSMFFNCYSLSNLGGFLNLGKAYLISQSANYSNYTLDLLYARVLTEQSIINILNNLYDIKTKGCQSQKVVLGSTNLAKLTSTEGQQALSNSQAKGWSIS